MIAMIFELQPTDQGKDEYLETAAALLPLVGEIDGFISNERFQSLTNPGNILSLAFFRDEIAVETWRNLPAHRTAQAKGREGLFKDYRLRIAQVIRDYSMNDRAQAPADSKALHG